MSLMQLKNKIMRRVCAIWFFRKIAPALFLQLPLFSLIALRELAREFWVAKIFDNFSWAFHGGFMSVINFVFSAVANAPLVPVFIILFSLGLFAFIFGRTIKNLRSFKSADFVKIYY